MLIESRQCVIMKEIPDGIIVDITAFPGYFRGIRRQALEPGRVSVI